MAQPFIAGFIHIALGAKGKSVGLLLGALINHRAHFSRNGSAVGIILHKILLDLGADLFEEIAQDSDDGKIAKNGFLFLERIVQSNKKDGSDEDQTQQNPRLKKCCDGDEGKYNGRNLEKDSSHALLFGEHGRFNE